MLRRMLALIVTLLVLLALAFAVLLWTTRVPPQMPATVTSDPSLPRHEGDGVLLHGHLAGAEGAPLIVVMHGGPGADLLSLQALEGMSDTHRVLFYDQRGAGLSECVTEGRLAMANHLADLDALITSQGGGPAVLIGHSWGALLATAYLGHRPEAVSRAILIEPSFLDARGLADFETQRAALSRSPRVDWAGPLAGFRAHGVRGMRMQPGTVSSALSLISSPIIRRTPTIVRGRPTTPPSGASAAERATPSGTTPPPRSTP